MNKTTLVIYFIALGVGLYEAFNRPIPEYTLAINLGCGWLCAIQQKLAR